MQRYLRSLRAVFGAKGRNSGNSNSNSGNDNGNIGHFNRRIPISLQITENNCEQSKVFIVIFSHVRI
ncbi:hypothetical protein ACLKA7_006958 [Drosophila subpalustris]